MTRTLAVRPVRPGLSGIVLRLIPYRWVLFVLPLACGLLCMVYFWLQPPVFTAYARLLPPQTNASSATALLNQVGGGAPVGAAALTLKNPSDLYASILLSRTVQDDVIGYFKLAERYRLSNLDKLRVEVGKRTKVEVGKDGIITLSYADHDPGKAADIATGLINAMYHVARRLGREEDARRMVFYDSLIEEARQKQRVADSRLLELELKTGLTRLKGQEEISTAAMAELRGTIATREVEISRASATATARHPELIRLQSELAGLRRQLGQMESRVFGKPGDNAPVQLDSSHRDEKNLFVPFTEYAQRRALVEPARRDVENAQNVVAQLVRAREFSRGDDTRDLSVMQVLDAAVPPTMKSGPRIVFNSLAAWVLASLLTLMAVLTWDLVASHPERRQRWLEIKDELKGRAAPACLPVEEKPTC